VKGAEGSRSCFAIASRVFIIAVRQTPSPLEFSSVRQETEKVLKNLENLRTVDFGLH